MLSASRLFLIFYLILFCFTNGYNQSHIAENYLARNDTLGYIDYILNIAANSRGDMSQDSLLWHLEQVIKIASENEYTSKQFWAKLRLIDVSYKLYSSEKIGNQEYLKLIKELEALSSDKSTLKVLAHTYHTYAYRIQTKPDSIIFYAEKSIELSKQVGDLFLLALAYRSLSALNQRLKKWTECIKYGEASLSIADSLPPNEVFLSNRIHLADCLAQNGDFEKALSELEITRATLIQLDWKKQHYLAILCKDSGRLYEQLNFPYRALEMQKLYTKAITTGPRLKLEDQIKDLRQKFVDQEQEKEILNLELRHQKTRRQRNQIALIAILFLTGILTIFTFYQLRQRYLRKEAERLKELDNFKTRFFTNITHEFRTPLTLIISPLKDMLQKDFKGNWKTYHETMLRNAEKLLQLVNELLSHTKQPFQTEKLQLQPLEINTFLQPILEEFKLLAQQKEMDFYVQLSDEKTFVFDAEKLEAIVTNLLSNAFKFNKPKGTVDFTTKIKKEQLVIVVSDKGIGIPKTQLPYIFDRFFQAYNVRSNLSGTGIGLALVKKYVEAHKGTVEVQSSEGIGTTFRVAIPLNLKSNFQPIITATHVANQFPTTNTHTSEQLTVLIAEDNEDMRQYIKDCISTTYQVLEAKDGFSAWSMAREHIPDLLISDVMMPEMDGFTLSSILKKDFRTSHIPIILLTARADDSSKLEGLSKGADAYLTKPFDKQELNIRLHQLIKLRQQLQLRYSQTKLPVSPVKADDNPEIKFLSRLKTIIFERLDDQNFKVEPDLCQAMLMSRPQLYRKLKALKNCSPSELIRAIRMEEARKMLLKKTNTVAEISIRVGFKNPSYFTKVYTESFGESPSQTLSK